LQRHVATVWGRCGRRGGAVALHQRQVNLGGLSGSGGRLREQGCSWASCCYLYCCTSRLSGQQEAWIMSKLGIKLFLGLSIELYV
jgi:hypothetical protein